MTGLGDEQPKNSYSINAPKWNLKSLLSRWSVGRKIAFGYAIAVGIGVIGTSTGIVIGDRHQREAWEREEHAQEEINLLYRLQTGVLQSRTHQQQLIPLIKQPTSFNEELDHLQHHAQEVNKTWQELIEFTKTESHGHEIHAIEVPAFVKKYSGVPETYFQQLEALVTLIHPSKLQTPEQLQRAQQRLMEFTNSSLALEFDGVSDELSDLVEGSYGELREAQQSEEKASAIRWQIILGSIVLSVLVATALATLTSRAIAHPLEVVNTVAKRVAKDSDFDLQAPVITQDEVGALAVSFNQLIQQVKVLLEEQKVASEQQLLQSEKMSSLGRMLAGVAHEINNPVNFIYGNLGHATEYIDDLFALLHAYKAELKTPSSTLQDLEEESDLEFLQEDLPKLLHSMKVGADRTRQIVLSLRNFSRLDESEAHPINLHDCIDSTLLILNNRIKKGITVNCQYGDLPLIEAYAGSLYQVFMNILSNALDAFEEAKPLEKADSVETQPALSKNDSFTLTISTEHTDKNQVLIRLMDNGPGIPPQNLEKIFDTFFTTKPMGVGTGLGLSISRQIIEEKHNGQISCKSQVGVGTEFTIVLPIKQPSPVASTNELITA